MYFNEDKNVRTIWDEKAMLDLQQGKETLSAYNGWHNLKYTNAGVLQFGLENIKSKPRSSLLSVYKWC